MVNETIDNRNYTKVALYIPVAMAQDIRAWMAGVEDGDPWDWETFIAAAWAIVPSIQAAYGVYSEGQAESDPGRPSMNLEQFAEYSVYEWFK